MAEKKGKKSNESRKQFAVLIRKSQFENHL